jgi:hypothetical protein
MPQKIDNLTDEQLETWRDICKWVWFFENARYSTEDFPANVILDQYSLQRAFIRGTIREYDVDDTRPFIISEDTGVIYYTDEEE